MLQCFPLLFILCILCHFFLQRKKLGGISEEKEEADNQLPNDEDAIKDEEATAPTTAETPDPSSSAAAAGTIDMTGAFPTVQQFIMRAEARRRGTTFQRSFYKKQPVIKKDANAPRIPILQTVKANIKNMRLMDTASGDETLYGYNRFIEGNTYVDDSLLEASVDGMYEGMLQRALFPNGVVAPNPLFEFGHPMWRRRSPRLVSSNGGELSWFLLLWVPGVECLLCLLLSFVVSSLFFNQELLVFFLLWWCSFLVSRGGLDRGGEG